MSDLDLCCSVEWIPLEKQSWVAIATSRIKLVWQSAPYSSKLTSCISPTHNPYFPYTYVYIHNIYSMEVPISSFSHSCPAYRLLRLWCGPCQERHLSLSFVGIQTFPNGPFSHDNLAFEGFSVEISMIRNLTRSVPRFVMEAVSASMLHTTWKCAPFAPKTNHVFPYGPPWAKKTRG